MDMYVTSLIHSYLGSLGICKASSVAMQPLSESKGRGCRKEIRSNSKLTSPPGAECAIAMRSLLAHADDLAVNVLGVIFANVACSTNAVRYFANHVRFWGIWCVGLNGDLWRMGKPGDFSGSGFKVLLRIDLIVMPRENRSLKITWAVANFCIVAGTGGVGAADSRFRPHLRQVDRALYTHVGCDMHLHIQGSCPPLPGLVPGSLPCG